MVVRGRVNGGVVVLDDSKAIPDGTVVRVEPVVEDEPSRPGETVWAMMRRFAGAAKGLPPDLARNHDHYLHGLPKK